MYSMVVNCGSSSLRIARYNLDNPDLPEMTAHVSGIGQGDSVISFSFIASEGYQKNVTVSNHAESLELIWNEIKQNNMNTVDYFAYRVVHGGDSQAAAELIDEQVISKIVSLSSFAPEHHPPLIVCMRVLMQAHPNSKHIACYDTAFFSNLPDNSKHLALPRSLYDMGVRRYGFHGLSYSYIMGEFTKLCGYEASLGRLVILHLGSGASAVAIHQGKPIDTTMSLTPNSGFLMSTRSGSIDPGVYSYLLENGFSNKDAYQLLSHKSGLLGVSGLSADMYTLLESATENNDAELAVDMFCREVKKTICGFSGIMGGVDSIIFTGGMGENAPRIRRRVLDGLEFMGVVLNNERNDRNERLISSENSIVGVHVIKTDESKTMINEVQKMLERVA